MINQTDKLSHILSVLFVLISTEGGRSSALKNHTAEADIFPLLGLRSRNSCVISFLTKKIIEKNFSEINRAADKALNSDPKKERLGTELTLLSEIRYSIFSW